MKSIAVIAPDTDSGKTVVTAALLSLSKKINGKSIAMKPVQTGAELINGKKSSPDLSTIEQLCEYETPRELYHYCAPYLFMTPCSPHLAARKEIGDIRLDHIQQCLVELHMRFRMTIVESAGGILSPLTDTQTNADLLVQLGIPAVMVVNNRIGSISQTLAALTVAQQKGIKIAGLVLVDGSMNPGSFDEEIYEDNAKTVQDFSGIENLIRIPRVENLTEHFFVLTSLMKSFAEKLFEKTKEQ